MQICIGFDIGRSLVKIVVVWVDQWVEVFYLFLVVFVFKIIDDCEVEWVQVEMVLVNGCEFFFGEIVMFQG